MRETPLDTSLCSHVILKPGLTVINDTLADDRMCDNPLCFSAPNLRFYAGVCLETDEGLPIGTLCVLDVRPRDLTPQQSKLLSVLGRQVMGHIILSRQLVYSEALRREVDHRVKNSLGIVQSVLGMQARQSPDEGVRNALRLAQDRVSAVGKVHEELHQSGQTVNVELKAFLTRLVQSLTLQASESTSVTIEIPSVCVSAKDAVNIGIIVNELVTNALRHGISEEAGNIRISGDQRDDRIFLAVDDDGKGLAANFNPSDSHGLGMRLALLLVKSFGSDLSWNNTDKGARFMFNAPVIFL